MINDNIKAYKTTQINICKINALWYVSSRLRI